VSNLGLRHDLAKQLSLVGRHLSWVGVGAEPGPLVERPLVGLANLVGHLQNRGHGPQRLVAERLPSLHGIGL
jgi:hypothetical protein